MEISVAAGTDGEETFEEGCGKTCELAVQAVYKGTGAKGGWNGGKGSRIVLERDSGPELEARTEGKGKRAKVRPESAGAVRKQHTLWQIASKGKLEQEFEPCGRRQRGHQ